MNVFQQTLCVIGLQLLSVAVFAQSVHVKDLMYSSSSSKSRLRFNVSASPKHRVFVLDKPSRLVIDIANAVLDASPKQPVASHPLFAKIRAAAKNDNDLRIVVDLKMPVRAEHFSLASSNKNSRYLTIDLTNKVPLSQLTPEVAGVQASAPKAADADSTQPPRIKAQPQLQQASVSEPIVAESEQPATLTAVKTSLSPTSAL
ncbi:AMIN domain-containing protein [Methylocucumis oryzae]|uniref:AMIN domain-containing protein n=1 Tax=Methylocucumis oryzae TaxID=1632867 RepID=UPI0009E1E543|nr:AMIN domain-containing protein [Methylocucumis oryzae]